MQEVNTKSNTAKLVSDDEIKNCQFFKVYSVFLDAHGGYSGAS